MEAYFAAMFSNPTGAHGPQSADELMAARQELNELIKKGFREPKRSFMSDPETKWRFGEPPSYDVANLEYMKGKSKNHPEGSWEQIVEDLVKTWEMEASHKADINQWKTITPDWTISANGWKSYTKEEAIASGNYNLLMAGCPRDAWSPLSWEETHKTFRGAFTAFPWEVLEVFSGPPKVVFTWRHWATFSGSYKGNKGTGEMVEMYGMGVAEVTDDLQLRTTDIYYKPQEFLAVLEGKKDASDLKYGRALVGTGCPILGHQKPAAGAADAAPK